jgi:hypothetical protein
MATWKQVEQALELFEEELAARPNVGLEIVPEPSRRLAGGWPSDSTSSNPRRAGDTRFQRLSDPCLGLRVRRAQGGAQLGTGVFKGCGSVLARIVAG